MPMTERISRILKLERGGDNNNNAAPVILMRVQNKSGGALARGDVVAWDLTSHSTADLIAVTTTTTQDSTDVLGMVFDYNGIADGAIGYVQIWGPTDALKVNGTTDIAIGDSISTYTVAKIAGKMSAAGAFARALEAYATNDSAGVIDAFITNLNLGLGL